MADPAKRLVDLSHVIEHGMVTYKGLPAPLICDYWTREASAALYEDGAAFQIGRIDMVANTGTYLDSPFHRYEQGADLAQLDLASLATIDGMAVRAPHAQGLAIDAPDVAGLEVRGRAVLFHTGWDEHWRTDAYFTDHPYLTAAAARLLVQKGAKLVGIDSHNIDDTRGRTRPVHSILLAAGIPICEHMTNLGGLPDEGFRFSAVPPKIAGMGTFPVRAFAELASAA
ncbi:MAG: Kynurenine formamidase, bacterial [uncultured Sphingosinicella sp.]|uniref:Kynurenine formamidase, bacterial n=1 Tax=uncultured Sphingosinicella sp. TaxID=478748 RepID=A0A6J4TZP9_9SPHN|nr:cyclase family protein [uncultured Sphingosinicella sp.]CAA9536675.1 MAG: Kynurenine formamidase, bacterial [uncultured Sphingosinicella sp.]